jgi:hypothetical protein
LPVGNSDRIGELTLCDAHRPQKFLFQHLARMGGSSMGRYANHAYTPFLTGMIINDFNHFCPVYSPDKTDPVLIIDSDIILTLPIID